MKNKRVAIKDEFKWLDKIIETLSVFKPVVRKVTANYKENSSNVQISLEFNDKIKKAVSKIAVPNTGKVTIESLRDMYTDPVNLQWINNLNTKQWELGTKVLPISDRFFLEVRGPTTEEFFKGHVDIENATQRNRENDDTCDAYWLCVSLCQVEGIETISKYFEIEEVNVDVGVKIGNHITPVFPNPITRMLQARAEWDKALDSKDRDIDRKRMRYKQAVRESNIPFEDLVKILNEVVDPKSFYDYLNTEPVYIDGDNEYVVNNVKRADNQMPPDKMLVESKTNLSLINQNPKGFLKFYKKKFKDDVAEKIGVEDDEEEEI